MPTLLVADPIRLNAEALGLALKHVHGFDLFDLFPTSGQEAVKAVGALRPDLTLLDYWMPEVDGAAAAATMAKLSPGTRVVMLSWLHGPHEIRRALESGAAGFLPKDASVSQVAEALKRALDGETPVFEQELLELSDRIQKRGDAQGELLQRLIAVLTPREIELLRMLDDGLSNMEIARALRISPATVVRHFHNVVRKTGTSRKEEALILARSCGLVRR